MEEEIAQEHGLLFSIIFIFCVFFGVFIGFFVSWFNLIYIALHKVDEESRKHGGELVAEVLQSHGVKFVFTLVGGHISPILVAAEAAGIQVVDTRHEVTGVFAADAVARLSRTIGVAAVTAGPGLTNTVTAVKNAQLAESPLLLIGGAAAGMLKGRGALQDIDQMSLFRSICKYCVSVTSVRDIVPSLRYAIQEAQSGTPGPVFVEFPIDILYPYALVKKEVLGSRRSSGLRARLVSWYLKNYVDNLFAGAWEPRDITPLPPIIRHPTGKDIQRSAELLSRAKRPLLLLGSQATLPPTSIHSIRRSVEALGVPCFLGGMSRGLLGKNSPLQVRHQRREALKEADLVILAGTVCDFRLSYGRVLPRGVPVIAVNRDKDQLYRNSDMFWKPSLAVCGDVGSFLQELSMFLVDYKCSPDWLQQLQERDAAREKQNHEMSLEPTDKYLNPLKLLYEVEKILPDNAILVADGGDFVGTAAYILRPRGPLGWLDPGAFGTLGVGGGFALGAKLCHPDAEVWILYGDGSCGFSVAEIDTMTRHKVPVIALVGNDAAWTQIAREQVPMFGSSVGCKLAYTDYQEVSKGYGGKGFLVSDDSSDLSSILKSAQSLCQEGHTVLVNALIGSSKFREGSISV
ncbi:acetolactate synthase-like protein [Zootermopsis nevadensis]|uniref:acetolactate synthase-like protein n=1 Tax=Zootermopsis nevadensis TaxID=136037 RepID=UPI000B8E7DCA|nr:acetolactate synthase-like protein [Zootermopsis nevadensis]